jgi:hypothetical protein
VVAGSCYGTCSNWEASLFHYDGRDWRSARVPGSSGHLPVAIAVPAANDVWLLTGAELLRFDGKRWSSVVEARRWR